MKVSSALPLSCMGFAHWHSDDTEAGIVIAKASFLISIGGRSAQVRPAELELADIFSDDPALSPLIQEQDTAPFKPKTDLVIRGTARSFEGKERPDWPVGISIDDVLNYGFHVRGPSYWTKSGRKWRLSPPEPVSEVPLTYALAYGGKYTEDDAQQFFQNNPSGQGFMTEHGAHELDSWPAPQIGLLAEFMDARPFEPMAVHGTMPIAKAWLPRRSLAGTFDSNWERDRHPRMPQDYDLAFWNAAHPRLQLDPYLRGDEVLGLIGMSRSRGRVEVQLPNARLMLMSRSTPQETPISMTLDTVDLDLEAIDDGQVVATLVWRALIADRHAYSEAEIVRG